MGSVPQELKPACASCGQSCFLGDAFTRPALPQPPIQPGVLWCGMCGVAVLGVGCNGGSAEPGWYFVDALDM